MVEGESEVSFEPRVYEVGFLVLPTVAEENVPAEVVFIKDVLARGNATMISEEFPRLRPLAYTIRRQTGGKYEKYQSAYFGWIKFEGSPAIAADLKRLLDASTSILRYLIIKTVRENTMAPVRPVMRRSPMTFTPPRVPTGAQPAPAVSEVELDKTIEALVKDA